MQRCMTKYGHKSSKSVTEISMYNNMVEKYIFLRAGKWDTYDNNTVSKTP